MRALRAHRSLRYAITTALTVLVVGTSGTVMSPARAATPAADPKVTGTITVSAASSLADVFPVIAKAFQKRYPGTTVKFNFGGSSTLVNQIKAGAPVDVLATASEPTMWSAVNAGLVGKPLLFAKNTMAIAMPSDNPARITKLSDLARPGTLVGVCAPTVPCGVAARDVLARNKVSITPVTQELDVRSLLGKVLSGDLDAGIVYVTDVKAAGSKVKSVQIPTSLNVTTTYPIATVGETSNPVAAQRFVDYVRYSLSSQGILRAYGFARPW
jgi:molybdate transport system substrate-binding protein